MVSSANSASIGAKSGYGTPGKGISSKEEMTRQSTALGQDALKMENSAVTVAVRVRPFNNREKTEKAHQVVFMESQETIVQHPESKQSHSFVYDFSFWSFDKTHPSFASQKTVYEKLALPLLERAFEGYNTCLFAYGQTGSGKSYTMMGFSEDAGVIPRFCEDLFSRVKKSENQEVSYRLEMSYFEVYNEKIHDLLVVKDENCQNKQPLRVREHPVFGPYVADLSMNVVGSFDDIQSWLELGNKQRATAATGMNDKSSRSHSVFTLVMTQTKTEFVDEEEHDHTITSRINLVDLAGSERCSTAQTSGDRLKEGVSINKSLLTLGKVISALSEHTSQNKKVVFIPYRESVLTWLLKESLGGNSKTAMIATISPAASYVEESLSTLRYAKQACMIINIAKVNEDTNAKLIRELKAEVEKLKAAQMSIQGIEPEKFKLFRQEIVSLKMQLNQQEREMAEAHRTWKEKLEQAEKRKREETKELQKAGITFKVDNRLPNLVNLNEDPQLSEMLLYMIKEGQTKVGRYKSNSAHDINLSGALIADDHCVISNIAGTVSITPVKDAKTYVNGILVSDSTVLHHGDRIILGGDHYFRFNHPVEVQSGKRVSCWTGPGDGPKDFEFAKNELLSAQRAQLEEEIEEARMKAKEEMIQGIQVAKEMAQKELSDQKTLYENRIKALEKELGEEAQKKKLQELNNKKAVSKIEELQSVKTQLELKVQVNKKRLEMEALATRQALSDHDTRHAKIIEALEAEKKKITEDLERIQQKRLQKEKGSVPQNSRRISGRLYEIRVHPIQSLRNSQNSARRGRCVSVDCLPTMAEQNHGGYQLSDNRSQTVGQMPFDWIDGGSISYHNFSLNVNYMPITGECVTIDPVTGSCCLEACSKPKRALCQYDKDVYEHLQRFSLIPQTSFFFAVSREPLASTVIDELQINPTGILRNLSRVNSLTGVLLKVLDENPDILTSADLLYLTQFMGTVVELGVVEMENVSEAFVSLAINWFKLASKVIDTGLSAQWLELTEQAVACTVVAALLHLFFMAAFTWMLVEGLLLWSKVVTVNLSEERRMKYYYLIGWGLPVLIVSITLAATSEKYSADGHCWLSVKNGVIWGFAGPVIFIIMVNILVLTRVVLITLSTAKRRAIMLTVNSSPVEQAYDQIRAAVKAVLVLLPILGLTWLCGVLVPFSIVMAYIFVLLNSLQVRSTINRIKERRRALNFSNCANSRPSSSLTSSRPASSPALGLQDLSHDLGLGSHCASEPDQQNIPKPDSSMVYENSAATSDRQLSIPSLPRGPDEDLPCFALGSLTPEQFFMKYMELQSAT
ncbi:UNVERIFIED_CONTAM: hypothetical protein FKN15_022116 [Acipenser sinensis]